MKARAGENLILGPLLFMIVLIIIAALLLLCYIVLLLRYFVGWTSIPDYTTTAKTFSTTISVIVPARNEARQLPLLLQSLKSQSYPADLFEVLIIDDFSTDSTAAIVQEYATGNIKLVSLKDHFQPGTGNAYKKKAIETGISQSTGSLIITTDADCYLPKDWLKTIAAFYEEKKPAFIAAPVAINDRISFIEFFQSLDFMTLQGITGAGVQNKLHSMCNGANLAYEKKAFYEAGGFKGIDSIASGDDMLLMHKIAKLYPAKIAYLKSPDVLVQTAPVRSIAAFFNQRIRWASKANKYDDKSMLPVLMIVYFLNVMMAVLPLIGLLENKLPDYSGFQFSVIGISLYLLAAKIIFELFFLYPVAAFFKKRYLLFLFPLMQPFHILYTIIAGFLGRFGTYTWKDRKVK